MASPAGYIAAGANTMNLPKPALACVLVALFTFFATAVVVAAPTDDVYQLGPDSAPHPGVPQGKVVGPTTLPSQVFPNTTRDYWVYIPAQYDGKTPACLMIFQDGHFFVNPKADYRI